MNSKRMEEKFYFTTQERGLLFTLYKRLVKLSCDAIQKDDCRKLKNYLTQFISQGILPRNAFGMNPIIKDMQTAVIVAEEIGMEETHAKLLPQDKLTAVQELLSRGNKVAFVGDGVNDAPVLSVAQVGVAMGGVGSDAAVEASDLVLLKDDLLGLPKALKIARRTIAIARQNIAFALIVKFGVMLLSIPGIANMWMAVFADVGVAFLAILNAVRIMKY